MSGSRVVDGATPCDTACCSDIAMLQVPRDPQLGISGTNLATSKVALLKLCVYDRARKRP